jgi:predicted phosphodiesterase
MSQNDVLKILVISDLHCRYKPFGQKVDTRLHSNILSKPSLKHPVEALKILAKEKKLTVDIILCPGDITDKSDDQGYLTGFNFLKEIRTELQAKHLVCTIGNHDIDSRGLFGNRYDEIPRSLDAVFPIEDPLLQEKFWSNHYCILRKENFAILVFNSSYSHTNKENADKSIIDDTILESIEKDLKKLDGQVEFKVALCHHHPAKHANISYRDDDVIDQGDALLRMLYKYDFQILIHGHKHDPRLSYFNSLPVLCAGSFSSYENVRELAADNVFHIVTLRKGSKDGTIATYNYGPHNGWQINGKYFPGYTGFGYQGNLGDLAKRCKEQFSTSGSQVIRYHDMLIAIPELQFLIPEDQQKLTSELRLHDLTFTPQFPDLPTFISKSK